MENSKGKAHIDDVCDYVISRLDEEGRHVNVLKLHKVLYYCQAWSLAFGEGRLFDDKFQAWVHGPVSRSIYDRYKDTKTLYSTVSLEDVRKSFSVKSIPRPSRETIKAVLEKYGGLTGDQLEQMTHRERPWKLARKGLADNERSEVEISEKVMKDFYGERLKQKE